MNFSTSLKGLLQVFLQVPVCLSTFVFTPGSYLYTEYQEMWNMFFPLLKLELKWIIHSICKACPQFVCKYCVLILFLGVTYTQFRVSRNNALEYSCKLCCQTCGNFLNRQSASQSTA